MSERTAYRTMIRLLSGMGLHTYLVSGSEKVKFIGFTENTDSRIYLIPVENKSADGYPIGQVYLSEEEDPGRPEVWYSGYLPSGCLSGKAIRRFIRGEENCSEALKIAEAGCYIQDTTVYLVAFRLWLIENKYRIQEVVAL